MASKIYQLSSEEPTSITLLDVLVFSPGFYISIGGARDLFADQSLLLVHLLLLCKHLIPHIIHWKKLIIALTGITFAALTVYTICDFERALVPARLALEDHVFSALPEPQQQFTSVIYACYRLEEVEEPWSRWLQSFVQEVPTTCRTVPQSCTKKEPFEVPRSEYIH